MCQFITGSYLCRSQGPFSKMNIGSVLDRRFYQTDDSSLEKEKKLRENIDEERGKAEQSGRKRSGRIAPTGT